MVLRLSYSLSGIDPNAPTTTGTFVLTPQLLFMPKKLPLRIGHLLQSCTLLEWIIAHAHLCSSGPGAGRSFQNGRS